ncbi:AAA family ATPase [Pedobacter hiemivivus]|uniref:AAA family ATPase n=2 Tax=Pedobacter hiemivivus TaxID=2530454 RepID=A0A4U1GMR1_9SPHI|nr:AAA family ATPase [Pedobacter hiemivivus]
MIFFNDKDIIGQSNLSLIAGLANQISIAILNIMANEEIKQRENEKSLLLSFSNVLAAARNRKQLSMEFSDELRKFGIIGKYSLRLISEDQRFHHMFLYDERDDYMNHPDFQKILEMKSDVNDGITNLVLNSPEPLSFNIEALNEMETVPDYVKWWKEIGLIELTGLRVRLGDVNIGILWLSIPQNYDKVSNAPLLKNICSQIAIALSNVLANEKVIYQLNIIDKYKQQLEAEKVYLKEELETTHNYSEIIGNGLEMQKIFKLISQVSASDSTVLILGETGTGKELIARAIHNNSPRKNRLMIKVNCATLPANLIESELFGHERGSFTGATERRVGKFELANNGTLFLDEIGELTLELQVKLLRALQEKEIERIGGKSTIKVDVRIIAATNRNLEKEMEEGRFRSDLYYRLNIFPISLPPLRLRPEDIPLLTTYFIDRFSKKMGKQINKISKAAMDELTRYNWPGNIRELEHLIERSILLTESDIIKEIPLPMPTAKSLLVSSGMVFSLKTIDENERDHILSVLKYCRGRIGGEGGAAEKLGVPKSTLNSKIKRLGIRREHLF